MKVCQLNKRIDKHGAVEKAHWKCGQILSATSFVCKRGSKCISSMKAEIKVLMTYFPF